MRRLFPVLAALLCAACCALAAEPAGKVETGTGVALIPSDSWKATYPDIYESYMANAENREVTDYVAQYPMIATIYEGYGFAYSYGSARGHYYNIEDLKETGRPHALANCFTCKTADYTWMVNQEGVSAYSKPFEDVLPQINESLGCYTCHENDPSRGITVTQTYLIDALGSDFDRVAAQNASCGQCHVEYYFDPATKATRLPYEGLAAMNPDAMYDLYESMGFSDYTNPRTGVGILKAQHPEMETFLGEGSVHRDTFTCADCHMGTAQGSDGKSFVSHKWVSPLESETIKASCAACHSDLPGFVHGIQEKMEARTVDIGNKLEELTNRLAEAVEKGTLSEERLATVRALNRKGQWYWDFVFVENSEGAHNSRLDNNCLDKAEAFINAALKQFDV